MITTRPELSGTFGMVASTNWLSSQSAMSVLENGGNAVDAAVAAGFVMHVVEPNLNGPGGEVPLLYAPAGRPPTVLCGQGVAPAAATIEHFTGLGLDLVPGTGLLAATVPGAVGGWLTLLRDHGTWRLRDVLSYAIGYAEAGHPVFPRVSADIASMAQFFRMYWPTSAQVWLPHGRPPWPGERFSNPALATTYRRLLIEAEAGGLGREARREEECEAAVNAWYSGFTAEAIDLHCRQRLLDSTGEWNSGLLTGADLAAWRPTYEPPVTLDWRGWTVCKVGAWSQGPAMLQQLALLDGLLPERIGIWDAETVHLMAEAAKLAFADREAWYGDSLYSGADEVPVAALLDPDYTAARRALLGPGASAELRPGAPGGREPRLPEYVGTQAAIGPQGSGLTPPAVGVGEPTVAGDTCHLDVVDRWGNMVSATPSGGWLQSSPVVPELGFALGTRAQMFWLEPGLPASLRPGRRPRTTLTPTIAMRDGEAVLGFGTPGGDQQDQWQVVFWLAHVLGGANLQEAIDAPSWHSTAFPGSFAPRKWEPAGLTVESRLGDPIIGELRARGHDVTVGEPWSLGRMSAVSRNPETGVLRAGANPRGMQGYAVGR